MVKYGAIYCSQSVWLCFQPDRRRVCLIRCLLHAARPDKFVSESALIINCQRIICTVERSQKKLLTVSVNKPETEQASLQNLQLNGRWNMFVHIQTADDHVCLGSRIKRLMYLFPLWSTNLPRCGRLWWFSTDAPTRCGCCKKKRERKKRFGCESWWRIVFWRLQDTHRQSAAVDSSFTALDLFPQKRKWKENPNQRTDGKKRKAPFLPAFRDQAEQKFGRRKAEKGKVGKLISDPKAVFEDVGSHWDWMGSAAGYF